MSNFLKDDQIKFKNITYFKTKDVLSARKFVTELLDPS